MSNRIRLRRADGQVYLERWGFGCKWFGVYVHRMDAPDPGVHLHDHPWYFASLILKGGYIEERTFTKNAVRWARIARDLETQDGGHKERGKPETRRWLSFKGFGFNECHRIVELRQKHSWSLIVRGPKRDHWSFYTEQGVIDSENYEVNFPERVTELRNDR